MLRRLYLGIHDDPEKFTIFDGERILLKRVAAWVKEKVSKEGNKRDYSFFSRSVPDRDQSITTQTAIGKLFGRTTATKRGNISRKPRTQTTQIKVSSADENHNEAIITVDVHEKSALTNFIIESCQMRLKHAVKLYLTQYPAEIKFMESCGTKVLEELNIDIAIEQTEFDRLFTANYVEKAQSASANLIKAAIKCYCSIKIKSTVSIYFRCNRKWIMFKTGKVRPENPVKELSTSWITTNFDQHLKTHQKHYNVCFAAEPTCKFLATFWIVPLIIL